MVIQKKEQFVDLDNNFILGNYPEIKGKTRIIFKGNVTIQYPVKGTLIFGQNRENKDSASSSF